MRSDALPPTAPHLGPVRGNRLALSLLLRHDQILLAHVRLGIRDLAVTSVDRQAAHRLLYDDLMLIGTRVFCRLGACRANSRANKRLSSRV
jgi:hypothetical protein